MSDATPEAPPRPTTPSPTPTPAPRPSPSPTPPAAAPVPAVSEFDPIVPELKAGAKILIGEAEIHLPGKREPGVSCRIAPFRTRELLALGRILTGSTRPVNILAIVRPVMEAETDAEQSSAFIAAFTNLLVTVPHSEQEFINLLQVVTVPSDESLKDDTFINQFYEYLKNPDPVDTIRVFVQAYANERDRMSELGKALLALFPGARNAVTDSEKTSNESPGQLPST
jgi:hypothetical protein